MYINIVSLAFMGKAMVFCVEFSSGDVTFIECLFGPVRELYGLMRSCDQRLHRIPSKALYSTYYRARTAFYNTASLNWICSVSFTFLISLALVSKGEVAIVNSCV